MRFLLALAALLVVSFGFVLLMLPNSKDERLRQIQVEVIDGTTAAGDIMFNQKTLSFHLVIRNSSTADGFISSFEVNKAEGTYIARLYQQLEPTMRKTVSRSDSTWGREIGWLFGQIAQADSVAQARYNYK